jgi:hypothetical protein
VVYSSCFNQDRQSMATALANRRNGNIVPMLPWEKKAGLSPRAYEARLDLCRLWDLVCRQKSQTEIAHIMGKDPAWVSRSIKRIQSDFSTVYGTPTEEEIIMDNLARIESLYSEALNTLHSSNGYSRISALRVTAEIVRQKSEYELTVGWVANRRYGKESPSAPTMEELRDEISMQDLEAVFVTVGDSIKRRRMKAANARTIPALPAARQSTPN